MDCNAKIPNILMSDDTNGDRKIMRPIESSESDGDYVFANSPLYELDESTGVASLITISYLQKSLMGWLDHNFPKAGSSMQFLGVVEEVGELAHHILKGEQGIRGESDREANLERIRDDVGDIFIFLANFCNRQGISMEKCVLGAYSEVMKRDWIKFPVNGVTE